MLEFRPDSYTSRKCIDPCVYVCTSIQRVWWGGLREGDDLKDIGVDGRIIFKRIPKKWDGPWTGLILLTIGTGGWLLRMR